MLTVEEIEFVKNNIKCDINLLSLNKDKYKDINIELCIAQIKARQKTANKLTSFNNNYELIFPVRLSIEQSSSDITAEYKANILNYSTSIDLTGGMGIDSIHLANKAEKHIYIEQNTELCKIFKHNINVLNLTNIEITNSNSIDYLSKINKNIDLIYIDPARRAISGSKNYFLTDTEPNPIKILDIVVNKNNFKYLMIKTSPLLDISQAEKQLGKLSQVHIISIDNECKELILIKENGFNSTTKYFAVNFTNDKINSIEFIRSNSIKCRYSEPQKYLYEPNSSLMKLGFWDELSSKFNIFKLAPNSHLFTSENIIDDFPGRIFEITSIEKLDKKSVLKHLPNNKANISVRNFPLKVDEIKKKIGIIDGGDIYIFATELYNTSKIIIISKKLK